MLSARRRFPVRPLNLPLWAPPLKLQALSQSPVLALQTFFSPIGPTAVQPLSPLQPRTLSEAAQTQGHALQVGVQRKLASNLQYCRDAGLSCVPLVAETLRFGRGFHFYHSSHRPINSSPIRCRPRYGHNETPFQQSQLGFVAGQCLYADS